MGYYRLAQDNFGGKSGGNRVTSQVINIDASRLWLAPSRFRINPLKTIPIPCSMMMAFRYTSGRKPNIA